MPFVGTPPRQTKTGSGSRVSEIYRGFTIFYAPPPSRTWSFRARPDGPLEDYRSAFQARAAINLLLDGETEAAPRRSSSTKARPPDR